MIFLTSYFLCTFRFFVHLSIVTRLFYRISYQKEKGHILLTICMTWNFCPSKFCGFVVINASSIFLVNI